MFFDLDMVHQGHSKCTDLKRIHHYFKAQDARLEAADNAVQDNWIIYQGNSNACIYLKMFLFITDDKQLQWKVSHFSVMGVASILPHRDT